LSEKFVKKWGEREEHQQPFGTRIKEAVRPPGPLKPRLDFAVRRIEVQIQRLDQAADHFSERDKSMKKRRGNFLSLVLSLTSCSSNQKSLRV
jgi:hypothetical protein